MRKSIFFASLLLSTLATAVAAEPPRDLDACLTLSAETVKSAAAKIKTEAEYKKFYLRQLDLASACGLGKFEEAEKIVIEIRITYRLD